MKKKGYTLIELIAVMAIMIILIGSGFTIISSLKYIKDDVEIDNVIYEIYDVLSYAKAYCRRNFQEGEVLIDTQKRTIQFRYIDNSSSIKTNIIREEKFPKYVDVHTNPGFFKIEVSDLGYLKKAGSIFVSIGKKEKIITIAVGNDITNIIDANEKIDEINK